MRTEAEAVHHHNQTQTQIASGLFVRLVMAVSHEMEELNFEGLFDTKFLNQDKGNIFYFIRKTISHNQLERVLF